MSSSAKSGDRPSGRGWPIAMGSILALTVAVNLYVFRLASSDPSFSVEPSYYQKAVNWDDELAQRRHNAALGWVATAELVDSGDGATAVRVRLTDSAGAPLGGADVQLEAFAISRASQVVSLQLPAASDTSGGVYAAPLPSGVPGRWELRLDVGLGDERFTSVSRVERVR